MATVGPSLSNIVSEVLETNWTNLTSSGNDSGWWDDFDLYVHPHWKKFNIDVIPPWGHYVLGIYIGLVGIAGVLGNFMVIYMFLSTKNLRTPPNMFIVNLAFSDMSFSAINGFPLLTISSFMKRWYFGKVFCEIYAYLGGVFGLMSINTLAWIAIDRYIVIAKPFYAMRHASMKRSMMQLIVVWFWAFLWATPPLFGWGKYIPEGFHTSCSFDYLTRDVWNISFYSCLLGCGFLTPLCIIIYCYVNIVRAVINQHKEMSKHADKMKAKTDKEERERQQEIQTAKIAAGTIGLFLMSWLPYATVSLFGMIGLDSFVTPFSTMIPVMFAKTSAMYNPIVYALTHPRYKAALIEKFPCFACILPREKKEDARSNSVTGDNTNKGKRRALERSDSEMSSEVSMSEITDVPSHVNTNPTGTKNRPSTRPPRPALSPQPQRNTPGSNNSARIQDTGLSEEIRRDPAMHTLQHLEEAYKGLKALARGGVQGFANPAYEPDSVTVMKNGVYYTPPLTAGMAVPHVVPYVYPAPMMMNPIPAAVTASAAPVATAAVTTAQVAAPVPVTPAAVVAPSVNLPAAIASPPEKLTATASPVLPANNSTALAPAETMLSSSVVSPNNSNDATGPGGTNTKAEESAENNPETPSKEETKFEASATSSPEQTETKSETVDAPNTSTREGNNEASNDVEEPLNKVTGKDEVENKEGSGTTSKQTSKELPPEDIKYENGFV